MQSKLYYADTMVYKVDRNGRLIGTVGTCLGPVKAK